MIDILLLPFLTCIALVLIHVYFGTFVLKRGIVFIDLALAQWAALGYVIGNAFHIQNHTTLFIFSFGFTVIAGFILTLLKPIFKTLNLQEAVIGVMYILATTLALTVISSTGMEGHHIKEMLSGHILFIQTSEFLEAISIYSGIGILLLFIHKKILNSNSRLWDFVFYILFGFVVTSSVKMVGVLLVFSYLVLPVLSITLITKELKKQIIFSWIFGLSATLLGLALSISLNTPPSFCIILMLCIFWVLSIILFAIKKEKKNLI
ncbi:hypothetical protein DID78_00880 [Candidatus Marinamargulisbacteria bacterium SCGC AG-343-D04]|nr:hypothetical protein DID78_00880 [Candidatus Marinamargulisbacteria bacterium SCGC AG-343-D04]